METIQFRTVVNQDQVIRPPQGITLPQGEIEVTVKAHPADSCLVCGSAGSNARLAVGIGGGSGTGETAAPLQPGGAARSLRSQETAAMTEVFTDAFYYIALLNPADQFHAAAIQL